jgi:hypothetical protein
MVKEIVLIILLFNGEMLLKPYNLIIENSIHSHLGGTVHECFEYGDKLREELSTYNEEHNFWRMNHGSGTWQGFICQ